MLTDVQTVRIRQVPSGLFAMLRNLDGSGDELEMSADCALIECGMRLVFVENGYFLRHVATDLVREIYS